MTNTEHLIDVNKRLKEVDQAITDFEWGIASDSPEYMHKGPNALQALYLEREELDHAQKLGELYIPQF